MSRIYEALQRADRERQANGSAAAPPPAQPIPVPEAEEIAVMAGELTFAQIAQQVWHPDPLFFTALAERGVSVEQFRSLRSRIYQARYESPLKTILVSSGMPAEGKTFVSANLAVSLAHNGIHRILLIDGDLRCPSLHTLLGAPNQVGLSEYLAGRAELSAILQRQRIAAGNGSSSATNLANLAFIPAGQCSDISSQLLANHRLEMLLSTLAPHFDWIVIDSPPVLAVSDAVELAHAADAVLLIARGGSTPFEAAQRAQSLFASSRILGFVLNDITALPRRSSYYGYYYKAPEDEAQGLKA